MSADLYLLSPWMRAVIKRCAELGGKITSQEIHRVSRCAGRWGLGADLVGALRKSKKVRVEVVDERINAWNTITKSYRVTVR
jgi:hypothetical protein